jgi:hypothetical protein
MKYQYCILSIVLACLIGCIQSDPRKAELVPAGGQITYNNSPLENATIVFMSMDSDKQGASALSDSSGKFTLTTISDKDGALAGEYSVYVLKEEFPNISDDELMELSRQGKTPPKPKSLIPVKYSDPGNPIININIPPTGDKNIQIELKD